MVDIVVEDEQWMKLGEDGTQSHVQGRATPADLYKRMAAGPLGTGPMGRPCGDLTQALRKDVVSAFKNRRSKHYHPAQPSVFMLDPTNFEMQGKLMLPN